MKVPPNRPPFNPFEPQRPAPGLHPLALIGVLVSLAGLVVAVVVYDWRWFVIGPAFGLALMFLGGFAQQRQVQREWDRNRAHMLHDDD